ncbi:hypothetical protein Leryth_010415 [Lithospermum erythrorhizon]|uniref:Uncharacterized protein n=1 Tax=Lithospermum erythrorhizon TaxID=34254 RepID=A0AAV3PWM9_LITER|nr:hypothetical protein Leryth_010415 [Lithospermum erythrorhizon]
MEFARPINGGLRRSWTQRSRRGMSQSMYNTKMSRSTKVVTLGGGAASRNLWSKLKNGYMNMMSHLGGNNGDKAKKTPKARGNQQRMSNMEFDNRLIHEIYKSMSVSLEMHNR